MAHKPNQFSPDQMNAFIEQQVVNTRILSLKHAQKLANLRHDQPDAGDVDKMLEDAKKIADYLIDGLDGLKKKSGLVLTSQMPPPGAGFKPGD